MISAVADPDQAFGEAVKRGALKSLNCLNTQGCLRQLSDITQKWLPLWAKKVVIFVGRTSDFLNVFERVSWWSFRVPTPFSLLCLILLITHFHINKFPS